MTESNKLRQERDQWKNEALRLREHLGDVCRALGTQCMDENVTIGFLGKCVEGVCLMRAENEALRKRLASATVFRFSNYKIKAYGGRVEVVTHNGDCLFCTLRVHVGPEGCYFDTFEEAEAAARKALEVQG